MAELLDTNVIVRYLVETPESIPAKFRGVFPFFDDLAHGKQKAYLPPLVLFQTFFVLTSFYKVPTDETAEKLTALLSFKGISTAEKAILCACLRLLQESKLDLVDAYILAYSKAKGFKGVYSFDKDLQRAGLALLPIG
ncbi:MAG: PIN domain-containing protein [Candidatus Latescibacteria bacterium]|nr:PIN domain-containing protein [Candidatus Latescibacterota bacterium]